MPDRRLFGALLTGALLAASPPLASPALAETEDREPAAVSAPAQPCRYEVVPLMNQAPIRPLTLLLDQCTGATWRLLSENGLQRWEWIDRPTSSFSAPAQPCRYEVVPLMNQAPIRPLTLLLDQCTGATWQLLSLGNDSWGWLRTRPPVRPTRKTRSP